MYTWREKTRTSGAGSDSSSGGLVGSSTAGSMFSVNSMVSSFNQSMPLMPPWRIWVTASASPPSTGITKT